jgi:hypothetical protein
MYCGDDSRAVKMEFLSTDRFYSIQAKKPLRSFMETNLFCGGVA